MKEDLWKVYREHHLKRLEEALMKKEVDPPIVPLLNLLNSNPNYITTSSCSGRIILLSTSADEDKYSSFFHRKWHRPVIFEEVWDGYKNFQGDYLWFKMDPFILHVAAKDLPSGYALIRAARSVGIKIAGIQVIHSHRVNVEIRGIDSMAVPLYWEKPLVDKGYIKTLVAIANKKMVKNINRLEKLYNAIKNLIAAHTTQIT